MNPAIGRGIAFHYSSSIEVKELTAILGISINGIDYESPDQQKVHFILLILDTVDNPVLHRKLITRFQKFINSVNMKTKILDCKSNSEVLNLITHWENKYLSKESM
jgi:mannitol/fructose-specific phosphotransferase system IIA component (Ntr-type)